MCLNIEWVPFVNSYCHCDCTQLPYIRRGRMNGYATKTLAYGAPDIVKKIYTGQLPMTYFNDICYGRKSTPQEFQYSTPLMNRVKELWEPKSVSQEQGRHVLMDIQDARVRRYNQIESQCARKRMIRCKRTEAALMRKAEITPRGVQAYLVRLEREKEKLDERIRERKCGRRKGSTM
ncbi:uncharacterized protein LOC128237191 isoform X2 [Mya arenaria]|uniref:uncharacterized protein LOC128237191 isoform X2 n=1 Tax=Mya arenaria TaxID=6604 RepID=UPI0022E8A960|nr:uncharacterized protein LOC128237191 isoform X2 [Mya arenaria]